MMLEIAFTANFPLNYLRLSPRKPIDRQAFECVNLFVRRLKWLCENLHCPGLLRFDSDMLERSPDNHRSEYHHRRMGEGYFFVCIFS